MCIIGGDVSQGARSFRFQNQRQGVAVAFIGKIRYFGVMVGNPDVAYGKGMKFRFEKVFENNGGGAYGRGF